MAQAKPTLDAISAATKTPVEYESAFRDLETAVQEVRDATTTLALVIESCFETSKDDPNEKHPKMYHRHLFTDEQVRAIYYAAYSAQSEANELSKQYFAAFGEEP